MAHSLTVEEWALKSIGCVWAQEHNAWAFPFWDGLGHIIGIQLRSKTGFKWTMTGTHNGLIQSTVTVQPTTLICEGASDCCAALGLGYYAIGRPSCSGGAPMIKDLFRRLRVNRAIIVADNDLPGLNGAKLLAEGLHIPSVVITVPTKDLRMFVQMGGTRDVIDSLVNSSIWKCR